MLGIVNHHYIRPVYDHLYPSIYGILPQRLEEEIRYLKSIGQIINQNELLKSIDDNRTEQQKKRTLITFDDGLKEQMKYAVPVLQKHDVSAVFFISTANIECPHVLDVHKIHLVRSVIAPERMKNLLLEYLQTAKIDLNLDQVRQKAENHYKYDSGDVASIKYILNFSMERKTSNDFINALFTDELKFDEEEEATKLYMSRQDIIELARKGMIGSHSHVHEPLGLMTKAEQLTNIQQSKKILEDLTGIEITGFSFPYGSKDACNNTQELLSQHGYHYGITMERAINKELNDPYYLARLDNNDIPGGKNYSFLAADYFDAYNSSSWQMN